jgi:hypothetical protein
MKDDYNKCRCITSRDAKHQIWARRAIWPNTLPAMAQVSHPYLNRTVAEELEHALFCLKWKSCLTVLILHSFILRAEAENSRTEKSASSILKEEREGSFPASAAKRSTMADRSR